MKKKLLITGIGGSLFPYLHESLVSKYNLFYVDSNISLSKLYGNLNFTPAPLVKDPAYKDLIIDIVLKEAIDYYIPLIDEELILAKSEIEPKIPVHVIAPDSSFIQLCLNKYNLMKELQKYKLSNIESYLGENYGEQLGYPIFIKPVSGRGSRGIRKIESREMLMAYYTLESYKPNEVLIQPFIKGQEYTIGVTINNFNQILCIASKRILSKKGITLRAVTENNHIINEFVIKLVELMRPNGPINIQLFLTEDGDIKVFEINPRYSTTTILEIEAGINVIGRYIECINVPKVDKIEFPKPGLVIHRRWESVFYNE